jgi:tetratricopeptide (TPR) repeat protein
MFNAVQWAGWMLIQAVFQLAIHTALAPAAYAQGAGGAAMTRVQALKALEQTAPQVRRAGVLRLAEVGTMADADQLALRLHDTDGDVRQVAAASLWQIWSRSGDKAVDKDYEKAVLLMEASRFGEALAAFSAIIKKRPEFAEAWNKRATIYYMVGEFDLSLKDCDEVMKRNPHHFGALSGYGQIYLQMGELDRSLVYFQRALKVNPDMPGAVQAVQMLEQQLRSKGRQST